MQTYKVPIDGYYQVSAYMTRSVPTGMMETVPNPKRKWWQFWKPKTIIRPEYRIEKIQDGYDMMYLKEGKEVNIGITIQRI